MGGVNDQEVNEDNQRNELQKIGDAIKFIRERGAVRGPQVDIYHIVQEPRFRGWLQQSAGYDAVREAINTVAGTLRPEDGWESLTPFTESQPDQRTNLVIDRGHTAFTYLAAELAQKKPEELEQFAQENPFLRDLTNQIRMEQMSQEGGGPRSEMLKKLGDVTVARQKIGDKGEMIKKLPDIKAALSTPPPTIAMAK